MLGWRALAGRPDARVFLADACVTRHFPSEVAPGGLPGVPGGEACPLTLGTQETVMCTTRSFTPLLVAASLLFLASCQESPPTMPPSAPAESAAAASPQALSALFDRASPEVMALPRTVFAAQELETGQLVFGVEHRSVAPAVGNVLERLGVATSDYRIEVTEPIRFLNETLRTEHRATMGGVQIQWSQYVCTLGFNVDHADGRSFITNSHCTDRQGQTGNTQYNQPTRTVSPDPIGFEADDPAYSRGGGCSPGKVCRYSDAARVLYEPGIDSQARIAKTTGENNGLLEVAGHFTITGQDNSSTHFSGTMHKVGRTTGWSSGTVSNTCATVNVSGSNIQLRCQTLVEGSGQIVAGGDSGSPVFTRSSGDNVTLRGILWGGSSSGNLFVFSPFSAVQNELGALDATTDGTSEPPVDEDPGSIVGAVTDAEDGTPLAGVRVEVGSTNLWAETDESGNYAIGDVPVGTHEVTASKAGYDSQTATGVGVTSNTETTVNFSLQAETGGPEPEEPTDGTLSVDAVEYSANGGRLNDRHLTVTVRLVDDGGSAVANAGVSIELSRDGSLYGTASGTTGSNGVVNLSFNNYPSGTYTTVVTDVSASGLTWDGKTPSNSHTK